MTPKVNRNGSTSAARACVSVAGRLEDGPESQLDTQMAPEWLPNGPQRAPKWRPNVPQLRPMIIGHSPLPKWLPNDAQVSSKCRPHVIQIAPFGIVLFIPPPSQGDDGY